LRERFGDDIDIKLIDMKVAAMSVEAFVAATA
jgi:hypothetical protein